MADDESTLAVHAHVHDAAGAMVGCAEVELQHRASDPYAIHMDISTPQGVVQWVMSRESLARALTTGQDGEADVQIFANGPDPDVVQVRLSSPEGVAFLHYLREDLEQFTSTLPEQRDDESMIDWDSVITDILGG